jgi:hypothetical protein
MSKAVSYKKITLAVGILIVSFFIAFYAIAWQEPAQSPPDGNVAAPLNVGNIGQSKEGGLILNTGGADVGLIIDQGDVCIGSDCRDAWPETSVITTYQMSVSSYKVGNDSYSKSVSYSCPEGSVPVVTTYPSYINCGTEFCSQSSAGSVMTLKAYAWKRVDHESSSGACTGFNQYPTDYCQYYNATWGMSCRTVSCNMEFQCGTKKVVGE